MSSHLSVLAVALSVLFMAGCTLAVTEPAHLGSWNDREVPPEVEQEDPKRDRCIENCG